MSSIIRISLVYWILIVFIYIVFPDLIVVGQGKLDTLYMVSTIFYSAVIGMVISNNVNLHYKNNKSKIRRLNSRMTILFTCCFLVETICYFFYNDSLSHYLGLHFHLIVLSVIVYSTIVYVTSMPIVAKSIARIEDQDFTEKEEEQNTKEYKAITREIIEYCDQPKSIDSIFTHINIENSQKNIDKYISPLLGSTLFQTQDLSICGKDHLEELIIEKCRSSEPTFNDLLVQLPINSDNLNILLDGLMKEKRIACLSKTNQYTIYANQITIINKQILLFCQSTPKSRYEILENIGYTKNIENFRNFIQPLLDSGQLKRVSGSGFAAKYISTIKL